MVLDSGSLDRGLGPRLPANVVPASTPCSWPLVGGLDAVLACAHAIDGTDALYPARPEQEIR